MVTKVNQRMSEDFAGRPNLLSNHNFMIASPDGSQPRPSATPTSYPPGYQIFSGVFANETTGITNLTYIDGRVSFSGGDFYMPVANTGAIARLTEFAASVADFDGKPRTRGVSFALVGDEYRVTVGVDALEDAGAALTPIGSLKLEQGSVATRHEAGTPKQKIFPSISEITAANIGDSIVVDDYYGGATPSRSGPLFFKVVPGGTGVNDGGRYIDLPDGSQLKQNMKTTPSAKDFGLSEFRTSAENRISLANALGAGNDKVEITIPAGTYQLDPIYIGSFKSIQGAGMNRTVLETNINTGENGALIAGSIFSEIYDLTLRNTGTNNADSIAIASWSPNDGNGLSRSAVKRVSIENFGIPIGAVADDSGVPITSRNNVWNTRFEQIFMYGYTTGILLSGTGCNNTVFSQCWFKDGVDGGNDIDLNNATSVTFDNCAFETTKTTGLNGNFRTCQNINFHNTYFEPVTGFVAIDTDVHFTGGVYCRAVHLSPTSSDSFLYLRSDSGLLLEPIVSNCCPISTDEVFKICTNASPYETILIADYSGGSGQVLNGGYPTGVYPPGTSIVLGIPGGFNVIGNFISTSFTKPFSQAGGIAANGGLSEIAASIFNINSSGTVRLSVKSSFGMMTKVYTFTANRFGNVSLTEQSASGDFTSTINIQIATDGTVRLRNDNTTTTLSHTSAMLTFNYTGEF